MNAAAECSHLLVGPPPPHPYDDGASQDGIWQPTKASECHGREGADFFRLDLLAANDAASGNGTSTMTSIKEAANLLVLFGLRAEQCVDLVLQDCRLGSVVSDLAEEICRRDVHRLDRVRDQELGHFYGAGLAGCGFGRKECKARRALPSVHQ